MKFSAKNLRFAAFLVLFFGIVLLVIRAAGRTGRSVSGDSVAPDNLDSYCANKLQVGFLSRLSQDDKRGLTERSFFSRKLHTCVEVTLTSDPKDPSAMSYILSDFSHDFVAPPTWHRSESPLHIELSNYGGYHHLHVEGYWSPTKSDPGQQSISDANAVKITCDYSDRAAANSESNVCIEIEGYVQTGSLQTDSQSYHVVSWNPEEIIATEANRGLSGSTLSTLLVHPQVNEVEVIDKTKMDEAQPKLLGGMAGKAFADQYDLHGGMYLFDTQGVLFECNQAGVVIDMRLDVAERYHGDLVNVPSSEWNAGSPRKDHKFTQRECDAAMQRKLDELR